MIVRFWRYSWVDDRNSNGSISCRRAIAVKKHTRMKMQSDLSGRLVLSIVLLLYRDGHLAAGNEQVCESKLNHDVYVPLNDLSCQDDVLDIKSSVVERYKSTRKRSLSDFDVAGILFFCNYIVNRSWMVASKFLSSPAHPRPSLFFFLKRFILYRNRASV